MFQQIYIEKEIIDQPIVRKFLSKYSKNKNYILCNHYGEIFNLKRQNFKLQKQKPAIILAKKNNKRVLKITNNHEKTENVDNYYFSHMQNCLYDCRYCFLQGMYSSAHYLWFVNYEDFLDDLLLIDKTSKNKNYFFSGYDCDSAVFEPMTGFIDFMLKSFMKFNKSYLEFRTKSTNLRVLNKYKIIPNVIAAFSFSTDKIWQVMENKVPSNKKRLNVMKQLSSLGWKVGVRIEPIIYSKNYQKDYQILIDDIFTNLETKNLESISLGTIRFPQKMYQKIVQMYPNEKYLHANMDYISNGNYVGYNQNLSDEMVDYIKNLIKNYFKNAKFFINGF